MIIRDYQGLPNIGKPEIKYFFIELLRYLDGTYNCSKCLDFYYVIIIFFYIVLKKGKLQGDSSFCFTVCAACSIPCLSLSSA